MISPSLFSQAVFLAQRIWLDAFLIWFDTRCVCRGVFIRPCFKQEIPNLKYLSSPLKRVPMAVLHAESISCTYSGQRESINQGVDSVQFLAEANLELNTFVFSS